MAFDEGLAERLRAVTKNKLDEKKMFGGLCLLDRGHMVCGIVGDELMVRTGPEAYPAALKRKHAREMDFTGRALKSMIYVGADGFEEDAALLGWVQLGLAFTSTLEAKDPDSPKKKAKKKAPKKKK